MLLELPSELLHEVLSNLAGNVGALLSCLLTCKQLYLSTQPLLYSRVELHLHATVANLELTQDENSSKEARLLSTLQSKPELVYLVHEVSIHDLFDGEELIVADLELNLDVVQDLFGRNDRAISVLSMLKYTCRLTIFAYKKRSWSDLNPEIQKAIQQAIRFPLLEWLDIHAMSSFLIPLLESCSGTLKHFSITTLPTLPLAHPPDLSISQGNLDALHLESLALSMSTPNLQRFVDWVPRSRLKLGRLERVVIRTLGDRHKSAQPLVWKLVGECFATLKELDFYAYLPYGRTDVTSDSVKALYDTIDLGRLAALKKLTVRYWLSNLCDANGQLSLLVRLLWTLKGANMLEELTLHFVVTHTRVPLGSEGSRAWEVLDEVIWERAPSTLRRVKVHFESLPDQERCAALEMVGNGLSRLRSRELLNIQFLSSSPRFTPFSR